MTAKCLEKAIVENVGTHCYREMASGINPSVLADIYNQNVNIAVWERDLPQRLSDEVTRLLETKPSFRASVIVEPEKVGGSLAEKLHPEQYPLLLGDIATLVDMFCCLFGLERAGLRITALDGPMCPKFHVDKVPCRLVTTYQNIATEWLRDSAANRKVLGLDNEGKPQGSVAPQPEASEIHQLSCGDVALLKGVCWEGNEASGLIHRSPAISNEAGRLLLTLDFAN
ncbi:DUF1826 domain-containing protein [Enterovibrio coralii]|uniref:Succinylglutamate desuccinylase n=1 Tax=Enterovibrio coralii TaxID=294935 RepID=A0A135I5H6_9GAMM|nr:DUF1826 domain-containing protein [Enterovibrio coralii]KXF80691.1 hypothetical protein ATN88_08635 [Enterovibrio coralii]